MACLEQIIMLKFIETSQCFALKNRFRPTRAVYELGQVIINWSEYLKAHKLYEIKVNISNRV